MMLPNFQAFKKIPRLLHHVVVTEKIDGTNGVVYIPDDGAVAFAGSRNRWLTPSSDNFGFAAWVEANQQELLRLGPGWHYGEWWGRGVQRGYGLDHRRFSLFNATRWIDDEVRPACCHVVPILHAGLFDQRVIEGVLAGLQETGSVASPGFMQPEGVMIYHSGAGDLFKLPVDPRPKGSA